MLRAPTWITSTTAASSAACSGVVNSVTTGRPTSALASGTTSSPSEPRPGNENGDVRGFQTPARIIDAPPAFTARATVIVWSRVSTVHGPAISVNVDGPTLRPAIDRVECSRAPSSRLASLYGREIGT